MRRWKREVVGGRRTILGERRTCVPELLIALLIICMLTGVVITERWDEDTVFQNQARGIDDKGQKKNEFINDTLRSEFHKKVAAKKRTSPQTTLRLQKKSVALEDTRSNPLLITFLATCFRVCACIRGTQFMSKFIK